MNQNPKLRAECVCVLCSGDKAKGLVVCDACHTAQKLRNDGDYSAAAKRTLADAERVLAAGGKLTLVRATPDGAYEGKPIWRGEIYVGGKWLTATNRNNDKLAYTTAAYAVAGVKVWHQQRKAA